MDGRERERVIHSLFYQNKRTFGQKAADILAEYAGSWGFIIGFSVFLVAWMALNVYGWLGHWDPYPFILLNLVLSCLAAIQAPIILMSQNRQSQKDRLKAEYDYLVNRRAEREVQEILKRLNSLERHLLGNKSVTIKKIRKQGKNSKKAV